MPLSEVRNTKFQIEAIADQTTPRNARICAVSYLFARLVIDQAHTIRTLDSPHRRALALANYEAVHMATATPLYDSILNYATYMHFLWKPRWCLNINSQVGSEAYQEGFDPAVSTPNSLTHPSSIFVPPPSNYLPIGKDARASFLEDTWSTEHPDRLPLWVLDPHMFITLLHRHKWSSAIFHQMFPTIHRTMVISINHMSPIMHEDRIQRPAGDDIPAPRIYTITLKASLDQQNGIFQVMKAVSPHPEADVSHSAAPCSPKPSFTSEYITVDPILDAASARLSSLAATDPRLCQFTMVRDYITRADGQKVVDHATYPSDIQTQFSDHSDDYGASLFFNLTADSSAYLPPSDNVSLLFYALRQNVKAQFVLQKMLSRIPSSAVNKNILFFTCPLSQWLVLFHCLARSLYEPLSLSLAQAHSFPGTCSSFFTWLGSRSCLFGPRLPSPNAIRLSDNIMIQIIRP